MSDVRLTRSATVLAVAMALSAGCHSSQPDQVKAPAMPMATSTEEPSACADTSSATGASKGTGSALKVTVTGQGTEDGAEDFVLPREIRSKFPQFVAGPLSVEENGEPIGAIDRALREGAFIFGHPMIGLLLTNTSSFNITLTDLRVADLQTVCLPRGLLVRIGAEGGDDKVPMAIDLDADRPVAMVPVPDGEVPYQPFFQHNSVTIAAGHDADLMLSFDISQHARAFDLVVSYVVGRRHLTQKIRPPGGLFRAMPLTCPDDDDLAKMSEQEVTALAAYRFDDVLQTSSAPNQLTQISPDRFAEECSTR